MNSYLQVKKFLVPEKTQELLKGWTSMYRKGHVQKIKAWLKNQSLFSEYQKKEFAKNKENITVEAPQASTRNNSPQRVPNKGKQVPKNKPMGQKKSKGKDNPYPQNYRIPKKETAMYNVLNMERTMM
ncbi:hypothetical protein O181_042354 [Austropuccinia psidii MF-1]|uniref:Uncharacterized protein n=1 Tax=Austropuccinia psidii MF-1 TaxID=1389203 RepID=A0A9Q3DFY9_9BASI|nr:hypothetical protein [Austropuccinia psidii MF-1]